jgi:hypothetical protein
MDMSVRLRSCNYNRAQVRNLLPEAFKVFCYTVVVCNTSVKYIGHTGLYHHCCRKRAINLNSLALECCGTKKASTASQK